MQCEFQPIPASPIDDDQWAARSEVVRRQVLELLANRTISQAFTPPSPLNFVLRMVKRSDNANAMYAANARSIAALNDSDETLLRFCERLVVALCSQNSLPDHVVKTLQVLLANWKNHLDTGNNLLACDLVREFAHQIRPWRNLGHEVRSRFPALATAFKTVPLSVRSVARLNLYVPDAAAISTLERIAQSGAIAIVDRIEVAQRRPAEKDVRPQTYPTVLLYLTHDALTDVHEPDLMKLTRSVAAALCEQAPVPASSQALTEYACVLSPNCTLTQGFRLYKRYLAILGLLDDVYDAEVNHAFSRFDQNCSNQSTKYVERASRMRSLFGPILSESIATSRTSPKSNCLLFERNE